MTPELRKVLEFRSTSIQNALDDIKRGLNANSTDDVMLECLRQVRLQIQYAEKEAKQSQK